MRVTVQEHGERPRTVIVTRPVVGVGRDPSNDVVLRDSYVSSRHGEIRLGPGGAVYRDLDSRNGTLVVRGGEQVPLGGRHPSEAPLQDGDELHLGDAARPVVLKLDLSALTPVAAALGWSTGSDAELDATHAEGVGRMPARFDREALLALHDLATRLQAHLAEDEILEAFMDSLLGAFRKATHVLVALRVGGRGELQTLARSRAGVSGVHALSRTLRDRVLSRGRALIFHEADEAFDGAVSLHESSVRAGLCAPLWNGQRIMGLVQVDQRGVAPGSFDRGDLEVLVVLAHQAAMALENARLNAGLKESCEQAVRGLVRALEAKDEYTSGHSEAVAELCARVAMAMGLPPEAVDTTRRAALLHDIGKIGIPHAVLNKTGPLTPEEFRVLKTHPTLGARILEPLQFLADLVPVVLHHHERWDGRGYPAALAGLAIPPGARILAAVDTYHALVSDRAYRAGVGRDVALAELKRCSGTQFDPDVIAALERVLAAEAAPVGEPAEVGADA